MNGSVFRLDGDAFFFLKVHRVHRTLLLRLVVTVGAAGLEKLIDESGLAVVNVGNDGEISNFERHETNG